MDENDKLEWETILEFIGDASYTLQHVISRTYIDDERFHQLVESINRINDICNDVYESEFKKDLPSDGSINIQTRTVERLYIDKSGQVYKKYIEVKE